MEFCEECKRPISHGMLRCTCGWPQRRVFENREWDGLPTPPEEVIEDYEPRDYDIWLEHEANIIKAEVEGRAFSRLSYQPNNSNTDKDDRLNLLQETYRFLIANSRSPGEVMWVENSILTSAKWKSAPDGSEILEEVWVEQRGTWEEFEKISNFIYSPGSPVSHSLDGQISNKLKVVGDGWWLERRSSESYEWWEYCTPPVYKSNTPPLTSIGIEFVTGINFMAGWRNGQGND